MTILIIAILILAFFLVALSILFLSNQEQPVEMDITQDGHGTSHDFYTNQRGK